MAKSYQQRPSQFLDFEHPWLTFDFDIAVTYFGNHIEGELAKCKTEGEKTRRLHELLGIAPKVVKISTAALAGRLGARVTWIPSSQKTEKPQ